MSNEVIALKVDTLVGEVKLLRQELVRRDVYDEQRRADRMELDAIKASIEIAGQRKWQVWLAVAAAAIALGKDVIAALVA